MFAGADRLRHFRPIADPRIENVYLIALEVLGCKDLNVAKPRTNRALAQPAKHEGEESTDQQETGYTAAHHEQGHHGATAIAKDITECKQQELAHDCLLPN